MSTTVVVPMTTWDASFDRVLNLYSPVVVAKKNPVYLYENLVPSNLPWSMEGTKTTPPVGLVVNASLLKLSL